MNRRAFALPLVLILALVGVLSAAVMLEREGAQRHTTARQINAYRAHHLERGIREIIDAWARQTVSLGIGTMIGADGRVMDLRLADGGTLSIFMADGQGSILTETAFLPDTERRDAQAILEQLRLEAVQSNAGVPDPSWIRAVGPVRVSAASAPEPVLRAVLRSVFDERRADELLTLILEARADGEIAPNDIAAAVNNVGGEPRDRNRLMRVLTTSPDLWDVTIEFHAPERAWRSDGPIVRYGGKMRINRPDANRPSAFEPMGSFLTWEQLPAD